MGNSLRWFCLITLALAGHSVGVAMAQSVPQPPPPPIKGGPGAPPIKGGPGPPPRFIIPLPTIDPKTPLDKLLPVGPNVRVPVYTGEDLRLVPEVRFDALPAKGLTDVEWQTRKAWTTAAALHLNHTKEDGFLKALLKKRDDLAGLPFVMGSKCRTDAFRSAAFKSLADQVRPLQLGKLAGHYADAKRAAEAAHKTAPEKVEATLQAHMDAVRQIGGPATGDQLKAVVQYLTEVKRRETTQGLARLAVFSQDEAARKTALEALASRNKDEYTDILVTGLRYPWPTAARNAAQAVVALKRQDLMPNLVQMLDDPDPRGPREEMVGGKNVNVARELVRINHHHNCMLCHAPAVLGKTPPDPFVTEVPLPSNPLQAPLQGYGSGQTNLLVRIDVTYLRQDFSAMQLVDEKNAWPSSQRFDFVVRKRRLTADEAKELRERLEDREPGVLSPYQQAAVRALRDMTGRDFEAIAEVWRRFLKLKKS